MFVIFGWEKSVKPIESIMKTSCYHCQNHSGWSVWKETEWVSLFFVKILPFINKYHLGCDVCGDSVVLKDNEARDALNQKRRSQELHDELVSKIEKHQFQSLSEGQISYRKAQLESRKNA